MPDNFLGLGNLWQEVILKIFIGVTGEHVQSLRPEEIKESLISLDLFKCLGGWDGSSSIIPLGSSTTGVVLGFGDLFGSTGG